MANDNDGSIPQKVVGASKVLDLTLTLDTNAYADNDVLADTQEISGAFRAAGGTITLQSITVLDESDQGQALDLVFLDAAVSIGTENGAVGVTDANARSILGRVSIGAGDFYDLVGSRVATLYGIGLVLQAQSTDRSLYVAAISRGTGTYAAAGIRLKLGVLTD